MVSRNERRQDDGENGREGEEEGGNENDYQDENVGREDPDARGIKIVISRATRP